MDLSCSYSGCPGSPKYTCRQDRSVTFCEYHIASHLQEPGRHEKLSLSDLSKSNSTMQVIQKIGDISSLVSDVMITGKDMFQEICNRLCQITDTLAQRQRDLLEIASSVTEDPKEQMEKLGDIRLKLRSREAFSKLVDQHFAEHDATVDFSLFSQDIKGIMEGLKESNEFLAGIKEEAGRDREARETIVKRLHHVEKSSEGLAKEFDKKLKTLEKNMELKAKYYAQTSETEHIGNVINQLAYQMQTTNNFVNQINARCENIEREAQESANIRITSEEAGLENRRELVASIENYIGTIQGNFNNQLADLNKNWAEREAAFRVILDADRKIYEDHMANERMQLTRSKDLILQEVNQTVQMMNVKVQEIDENCSKSVKKGIRKVKKLANSENERTENERLQALEWIRLKIQEIAKDDRAQKRVVADNFEEFKRQEAARIEEERKQEEIKKANEENRLQEQRRIEKERKADEERKRVEEKRLAEEIKRKNDEDQRKRNQEEENKKKADFNSLSLQEKKNHMASLNIAHYKEKFIDVLFNRIQEIKKSNDGLYVFVCKLYLGTFNQIVWV